MKSTSNTSIGLILLGVAAGIGVAYIYNYFVMGIKTDSYLSSIPMFLSIYFLNKK